jgi:hypothetical protein
VITKRELTKKLKQAEKERAALYRLMTPIDKKIDVKNNHIKKLKNSIVELELKEKKPLKNQIEYFLFEDGSVSDKRFAARDKFWRNRFGSKGLHTGGYYRNTKQISIMIKLTKGDKESLEDNIKQLTDILPYIKPQDKDYKVFNLFEHTLSEFGSYNLIINEERKEYVLVKTVYSSDRDRTNFKDLKSALEYIQTNHYYDSLEEEDIQKEYDDEY